MRLPQLFLVCAAILVPSAIPQSVADRETRAREYVQFLVMQLDQWTRDFPQAYDMALMRPPVDAGALSEGARAGAGSLRDSVAKLVSLSAANDLITNATFRAQLEKTLLAASPVNEALGKQRFPEAIVNDWAPLRTSLNSLADIYKAPQLPVLDLPAAASGAKGGQKVASVLPPGAVTGYVVDERCAARGKAMWVNVQCVQTCVRDGDKVVLVTEQGKIFRIANQEKIEADSYGQKVAVTGKSEGDTITVSTLQIL
ncbi:MAG: hypothetical protein QOJ99_529 [Bryobacterales bacterium]|jgi:hypothetical protein|nr:hypothetical protein [Bryobacterales bacterium]